MNENNQKQWLTQLVLGASNIVKERDNNNLNWMVKPKNASTI
jgi:hypothetical protein